mgnify:CR=1 FL=1
MNEIVKSYISFSVITFYFDTLFTFNRLQYFQFLQEPYTIKHNISQPSQLQRKNCLNPGLNMYNYIVLFSCWKVQNFSKWLFELQKIVLQQLNSKLIVLIFPIRIIWVLIYTSNLMLVIIIIIMRGLIIVFFIRIRILWIIL